MFGALHPGVSVGVPTAEGVPMRYRVPAGRRSLRLKRGLVLVSAVLCFGVVAAAATAGFRANSVVPVFCTSDTIPANTELSVRLRWGVSNNGQMNGQNGFLQVQKMTWTVFAADGTTVLASSAPTSPEFGDIRSWSPSAEEVGTITTKTGAVKKQKFTYSDYQQQTGVIVGLNQTVVIAYELSANAPTDDGFGWKFLDPGVISSGNTCRVTGVTP
jgi:hypothetical protein